MMGIMTCDVLNLCSCVGVSGRMEVLRVPSVVHMSAWRLISDNNNNNNNKKSLHFNLDRIPYLKI